MLERVGCQPSVMRMRSCAPLLADRPSSLKMVCHWCVTGEVSPWCRLKASLQAEPSADGHLVEVDDKGRVRHHGSRNRASMLTNARTAVVNVCPLLTCESRCRQLSYQVGQYACAPNAKLHDCIQVEYSADISDVACACQRMEAEATRAYAFCRVAQVHTRIRRALDQTSRPSVQHTTPSLIVGAVKSV
jgi:hypothetical protein